MARPYISKARRKKVAEAAKHRGGYCLTPQSFTAMPMEIEHIIPVAAGGSSIENNLWLACPLCNGYKGSQTQRVDLMTSKEVKLFNPRDQDWNEHFRWSKDGSQIMGQTSCGRATVIALKLNNEHLVRARRRWVAVGWHPPKD
jgi:5-methylcytosine-specific restriction endonuclease McrA